MMLLPTTTDWGKNQIPRSRPSQVAPASTSLVLPLPRYAASLCGQPRVRHPSSLAEIHSRNPGCGAVWGRALQIKKEAEKPFPLTPLNPGRGRRPQNPPEKLSLQVLSSANLDQSLARHVRARAQHSSAQPSVATFLASNTISFRVRLLTPPAKSGGGTAPGREGGRWEGDGGDSEVDVLRFHSSGEVFGWEGCRLLDPVFL